MEEEDKKDYEELASVKIDLEALRGWRKPGSDDLPITGFLSLYEALGLEKAIKEYCDGGRQIAAIENLACNFYTMRALKRFIEEQWQIYSLDIDGDSHVFWDPSSKYGRERHYPKKVRDRIASCIAMDFLNYCPGIDDELPDNVISLRVYPGAGQISPENDSGIPDDPSGGASDPAQEV